MNFDKRDELFAQLATDKVKRDKHIQHLSKARSRMFIPMIVLLFSSVTMTTLAVFVKEMGIIPVLSLAGAMMILIVAMQMESEIRTLKIVGALQEAQQTKDDTATS